jgi:hypothetical protein
MKHLIREARRTMCEDFGQCGLGEGWDKLGQEAGMQLGADMRVLIHAEDDSEEEQDVLSKWGDELEKTDGMFSSLPPEGVDQLRAAIESGSKDDAMATLAANGLDYLDLPDDWEEECISCQQGEDELPEQGDDETPEQYRDRTGKCPAGYRWDDEAGKCGETGETPDEEPGEEPGGETTPAEPAMSGKEIAQSIQGIEGKSQTGKEITKGPHVAKVRNTLDDWAEKAAAGEGPFEDMPPKDREALAAHAKNYKSAIKGWHEDARDGATMSMEANADWATDSREGAIALMKKHDLTSYEPPTPSSSAPSEKEVEDQLNAVFDSGATDYHTVDEPEHLEVIKKWNDELDKGDDGLFAHFSKKQQRALHDATTEILTFEDDLTDYYKKGGKKLPNRPKFVSHLQDLASVVGMIAGAKTGRHTPEAAFKAMDNYKNLGGVPPEINPKLQKTQSKISPNARRLMASILNDD